LNNLKRWFSLFLLIASSACQAGPTSRATGTHSPTPGDIIEVTPTPTRIEPTRTVQPTFTISPVPPTSTPEPPPEDVRPRYNITATLDYAYRILTVEQEIIFSNPSSSPLPELSLITQQNWRPGVFNLHEIRTRDGTLINSYSLEGIHLRVLLPQSLMPGERMNLSIGYEINIPPLLTSEDFGPNPFGYTTRQMNLTDWYPFLPPFVDGEGWLVHNPWYYGEHLVYPAADFEIKITLTNAPPTTLIAASALDVGDEEVHHYRLLGARNFVWSVSPEYHLFQEQVGGTTVLGYAFPYDVNAGEAAFKTTVEALNLYNQLFGPYPFESMTMIQADFNHGMEYSGLYFLSNAFFGTYDGTPASYLVVIAAHETAHQWWFGMVGNDQALEPWLDEALCTYSEKIYLENLYPAALNWWEYARVSYYEPSGWVDSTLYDTPGYRPYRDAIYLNGALFLDELRTLVGDDAFFEFLKDYLLQNTNKIATSADFFRILRTHSEADWGDLVSRYFQN
jgi:hypothetical protein